MRVLRLHSGATSYFRQRKLASILVTLWITVAGSVSPVAAQGNAASTSLVATTTKITSSADPSIFGEAVTLTATVTAKAGSVPDGETITFQDGPNEIGTGMLAGGSASLTVASLTAGHHLIAAIFGRDTQFAGSEGKLTQTVKRLPTSVGLSSGENPSIFGQSVALKATVSSSLGKPPDGEIVTFRQGVAVLGSGGLSGGGASFITSTLPGGVHSITASYAGDVNLAPSSSAPLVQAVDAIPTTTQISASPDPALLGDSVTFTARVASGVGSVPGMVVFKERSTTVASVPLSGGVASITKAFTQGSYQMQAIFAGNSSYSASSASLTEEVNACTAPHSLCSGVCVDEQTDPNNCGGCGIVCSSGQTCASGACTVATQPTDVVTYHYDVSRSGTNSNETVLTPANVAPATFGKLGEFMLDGQVDGQVLYLSQVAMPTVGAKNVLYVATENDTVYALDADSVRGTMATVLWKTSVLLPGEQAAAGLPCGNIVPSGITATPVIDRAHNAIYVVAESQNGQNYYHRIHALSLTTGQDLAPPTTIEPTYTVGNNSVTFSPIYQHDRAALLESGGTIYTVWSGLFGDCGTYSPWVITFDAGTLVQTNAIVLASPTDFGDGLWMGGGGPAADTAGNVYAITGNGFGVDVPPTTYQNSMVLLSDPSGTLGVVDYFSPDNTVALSGADLDFGSAGPLLLPDLTDNNSQVWHLAVGAGKDGKMYVVNRDNMGQYQPGMMNTNVYESFPASAQSNFSTPVYFNNVVYLGPASDSVRAFAISNAMLTSTPSSKSVNTFGVRGSMPSISANASSNGILWALNKDSGVLYAYDATNLATELYDSSTANGSRDHFAQVTGSFITPMVTNGNVYFGTGSTIVSFGLLP
jgi:Bacterial Ig-like domain (group 3)/Stigma-specific protein, Stig1